VIAYSVVLLKAPVGQVPLVGTIPCQPPAAVHSVASVEFHVRFEPLPLLTVVGEAAKVTDGADSATIACADCATEPPAPVHVSVKLVVDVSGSVDIVPLVAWGPLQPPDAVQLWAAVLFHFRVVALPTATLLGFNSSVMTGIVAAVAESALLPGLKEFCWQPARAAMSAHPTMRCAKLLLRPTETIS